MFFDKDKVKLTLSTSSTTYLPGDVVQGTLFVEVYKEVQFTAVRATIYGLERAWKRVSETVTVGSGNNRRQQTRTRTITAESMHYEQTMTFFGAPKSSGCKGGSYYQPGTYTYPFQIQLPPTIPPSFGVSLSDSGSTLEYSIKVYMDIPNGFDNTQVYSIRVLPCVPINQLMQARGNFIRLNSSAQTHNCTYCGCFCCEKEGEVIECGAEIHNTIPVLCRAANAAPHGMPPPLMAPPPEVQAAGGGSAPPPNANTMRVILTASNKSAKEVRELDVKLKQCVMINVQGYNGSINRTLAKCKYKTVQGELLPDGNMSVQLDLILPDDVSERAESNFPLPTLRTPFVDSTCSLLVEFPAQSAECALLRSGTIQVAAAVDQTNRVPAMPAVYTHTAFMPEMMWGQHQF